MEQATISPEKKVEKSTIWHYKFNDGVNKYTLTADRPISERLARQRIRDQWRIPHHHDNTIEVWVPKEGN